MLGNSLPALTLCEFHSLTEELLLLKGVNVGSTPTETFDQFLENIW